MPGKGDLIDFVKDLVTWTSEKDHYIDTSLAILNLPERAALLCDVHSEPQTPTPPGDPLCLFSKGAVFSISDKPFSDYLESPRYATFVLGIEFRKLPTAYAKLSIYYEADLSTLFEDFHIRGLTLLRDNWLQGNATGSRPRPNSDPLPCSMHFKKIAKGHWFT